MRRINISKDWLVEQYINNRLSIPKCALIRGCSATAIRNGLTRYNIPIRPLSESQKILGSNEEFRNKISSIVKHRYQDPSEAEKIKISMRRFWNDPIKHAEHAAKLHKVHKGRKLTDEQREKISVAAKERYKSPDAHKKTSECKLGPKNAAWRGGISKQRYCPRFNEYLREEIRNSFNRECFICGVHENGKKLDVHHVDYNKGQGCGQKWSLVPLCHSCHMKTNTNRWYWFNLLSNYWAVKNRGDLIVTI